MLELFTLPEVWVSLLTLTVLEIVLGIDNLVFIAVTTSRLPSHQQRAARQFGLLLACVTRILLLGTITWMTKFVQPLFSIANHPFSLRDLILIVGGLFLITKGTSEIHVSVVSKDLDELKPARHATLPTVVIQIMFLDIIFSLDSVIAAVGMAQHFIVMVIAIVIAVILMLLASEPLSRFIRKYPTLKMLALSFLLLVGLVLVADGFSFHIPREYLYFAIAFSIFVEIMNILVSRRKTGKN